MLKTYLHLKLFRTIQGESWLLGMKLFPPFPPLPLPQKKKKSPASRRTTSTKKENIIIQSCKVNFFLGKRTPIFPLTLLLSFPDKRRHVRKKNGKKKKKKIQKRHEVMGLMDRETHETPFWFDRLKIHQSRQSPPNFILPQLSLCKGYNHPPSAKPESTFGAPRSSFGISSFGGPSSLRPFFVGLPLI